MSNKSTATTFLTLAAHGQIDEAYERFVAPDFRHHNQYFAGDRQSLLEGMKQSHAQMPNKEFTIKMTLEDSDKVMTYSFLKQEPKSAWIVVVHIMRFNDEGKIVEMRDVGQKVEEKKVNENGVV